MLGRVARFHRDLSPVVVRNREVVLVNRGTVVVLRMIVIAVRMRVHQRRQAGRRDQGRDEQQRDAAMHRFSLWDDGNRVKTGPRRNPVPITQSDLSRATRMPP